MMAEKIAQEFGLAHQRYVLLFSAVRCCLPQQHQGCAHANWAEAKPTRGGRRGLRD